MKLIVGLGNPGKKYEKTRHNVGFMAIDLFAEKHQLKFKYEARFEGLVAEGFIDDEKVILLKPATYMNLSGNSVSKAINYYKLNVEDVLIVYDDVHLDIGELRLRLSGSSGGQKGMKDIINHLGTETIKRVRVGISINDDLVKHVLTKFSRKERKEMDIVIYKIADVLELFIKNISFENIMSRYNG